MASCKIEIRGKEYDVEEFSKTYLQGMVECLARNRITNVKFLSNSAQVIKKIAVPTISEEIVSESLNDEELYIWNCEPEEIAEVLLKVALAWFNTNVAKASPIEAELYAQQQKTCEAALKRLLETKGKDAVFVDVSKYNEIDELKARLAAAEGKNV